MKLPVTFLFLLVSISTYCQREILYDLDDYKQVVFKRSALNITPSGGLQAADRVNVDGEEANLNINIGGIANHSKVLNTQDEQYQLNQLFSFNISDGYRFSGSRNNVKRAYHENRYLKTGADISINYSKDALFSGTQIRNEGSASVQGNFGLGFGRLEFINHAWSAVQILQSLENNGLLLRLPTLEEITAFADKIGSVRTRRILDFRLRDIAILENMIEYLKENNFIDGLSTKAILIIEDTFEYDELQNRSSGNRLEFSLEPNISYQVNNTSPTNELRTVAPGVTGTITYEKHNNIDVKWYRTEEYKSSLITQDNYTLRDGFDTARSLNIIAGLNYMYGYQYIPNLRNNYSISLNSGMSINLNKFGSNPSQFSPVFFSLNAILNYRHYFSPATSLITTAVFGYRDNEFQSGLYQPQINGSFNFSIVHSLF